MGVQAQTVEFKYDEAGNRVKREILPLSGAPEHSDFVAEEITEEFGIRIYPNPTKGELKVELSGEIDFESSLIQVFTMQGVMLEQIEPVKRTNRVNLKDQAPGMYVLRMVLEGEVKTWTIIKQ
tara:strand:+ start:238 stop:606 length:369 start_codon:yes stop_codon:yes gene_type:complete